MKKEITDFASDINLQTIEFLDKLKPKLKRLWAKVLKVDPKVSLLWSDGHLFITKNGVIDSVLEDAVQWALLQPNKPTTLAKKYASLVKMVEVLKLINQLLHGKLRVEDFT